MQDLLIRFFTVALVSLISLTAYTQENNAPVIKFLKPQTGGQFTANSLIPYAIHVNDKEDGNSEYEEIAGHEVILFVKYLPDAAQLKTYLASIDQDILPLTTMAQSNCLNCHAATTKRIGPSFDLIAKKYKARDDAKAYLSQKVVGGSKGVWGEEQMPPNPDLKEEQVALIVDWILQQDRNPTLFQVGLEGAVRSREISPKREANILVLTAIYKDHGAADDPNNKKTGHHSITLKHTN